MGQRSDPLRNALGIAGGGSRGPGYEIGTLKIWALTTYGPGLREVYNYKQL